MSDLRSKLIEEFLANEDYAYGYYNDFLNVYIATQLKVLREQRGYETQTKFAEVSGISQEQISQMESIDRNSWTVNTLRKFARALGVTLRVSFESFSDSIDTIAKFSRADLERPNRVDELSKLSLAAALEDQDDKQVFANQTMAEMLRNASQTNVVGTSTPTTGNLSQTSFVEILQSGKSIYETAEDQSGESDMAFPFERSKSARKIFGEKRAA